MEEGCSPQPESLGSRQALSRVDFDRSPAQHVGGQRENPHHPLTLVRTPTLRSGGVRALRLTSGRQTLCWGGEAPCPSPRGCGGQVGALLGRRQSGRPGRHCPSAPGRPPRTEGQRVPHVQGQMPFCGAAALCSRQFLRKPEVRRRGHLPGVSLQLDGGPWRQRRASRHDTGSTVSSHRSTFAVHCEPGSRDARSLAGVWRPCPGVLCV